MARSDILAEDKCVVADYVTDMFSINMFCEKTEINNTNIFSLY